MKKVLGSILLIFSITVYAATGSEPDAKFIDMMTKHHREGLEMAKMATTKANSPEVKKSAEKMVKDQSKEIEQMSMWRQKKFSSIPMSKENPPKMDMKPLENAKGSDFDMQFTMLMAKHHEDGIKMAKDLKGKLTDKELKNFAEKLSTNQEEEKKHLEDIHATLSSQAGRSSSEL